MTRLTESDRKRIRAAIRLCELMNQRHSVALEARWYGEADTWERLEELDADIRMAQRAVNES